MQSLWNGGRGHLPAGPSDSKFGGRHARVAKLVGEWDVNPGYRLHRGLSQGRRVLEHREKCRMHFGLIDVESCKQATADQMGRNDGQEAKRFG